jgi:probable addiction module antidote protein
MANYRTIRELEEEYLRNHPDEIDDYITVLFDDYAESGDTVSLLRSLSVVSRVKGVLNIAETADLNHQEVQKALTQGVNPQFSSVNSIMHAIGYRLMPQKLSESA